MLSREKYLSAVSLTQIVSVDLIVKYSDGKILLGKRKNKPAQGIYFVPGGRVFKGERVRDAVDRQLTKELGIISKGLDIKLRCVSEHVYDDNFAEAVDEKGNNVSTHYVNFAYDICLPNNHIGIDLGVFGIEHDDIKFLTPEEIVKSKQVHEYVKNYFLDPDLPRRNMVHRIK